MRRPRLSHRGRASSPGRRGGNRAHSRVAHSRDAAGRGDGLPERTTRLLRRDAASRLAACSLASHSPGARSNQTRSPEPWHSWPLSMPTEWRLSPPSRGVCHLPHPGHTTARGSPGNKRTWPGGSSLARRGGLPSRSRGISNSFRARRRSRPPAGAIATAGDRQRDALHETRAHSCRPGPPLQTSGHDGRNPHTHVFTCQGPMPAGDNRRQSLALILEEKLAVSTTGLGRRVLPGEISNSVRAKPSEPGGT